MLYKITFESVFWLKGEQLFANILTTKALDLRIIIWGIIIV